MIYAIIIQFLVAPIAIKIFMDLIKDQPVSFKKFCLKGFFSLVCVFIESAIIFLATAFVKELCKLLNINTVILDRISLLPLVLNPLFGYTAVGGTAFPWERGIFLALLFHLYCQFPTFLLLFAIIIHNKKYIKKALVFYLVWFLVSIFLSIVIGETR